MKNNIYTFVKYQDRWYVDLPSWEGSKDDHEMVMGADTLLDIMSEGGDQIKIKIQEESFEGYEYKLDLTREEFDGGWYDITSTFGVEFECWLCAVTKFVFNKLPQTIYFRGLGVGY